METIKELPSAWKNETLHDVPIVLRDDGFTQFYWVDRMDKLILEKRCINYLSDTNVKIKEWGLGPGSVFTFDTKVGEVFGSKLSEKQLAILGEGDRRVFRNVKALISNGDDPLAVVVNKGHEIGLKVWARFEMNHEYGPADDRNWMWVGLVGEFNKKHPEYRIPNSVNMDYSIKEVRDFKLAIIKEVLQKGVDGISMDFAVYPPFLKDPVKDYRIMTDFIAHVKEMTEEIDKKENRKVNIIVRVPDNYHAIGLDWRTWIQKGLIDIIVPTVVHLQDQFDVSVDEFVQEAKGTGCKVFGCVRPYLGYYDCDPKPQDEKSGVIRYDREMTHEMFFTKAFLLLRAGVDGIQIATGSGDLTSEESNWKQKADAWKPLYNDLGNPNVLMYKDKNYLVNRKDHLPLTLSSRNRTGNFVVRIADHIQELLKENRKIHMKMIFFCSGLEKNEKLNLFINKNGPLVLTHVDFIEKDDPIETTAEYISKYGEQIFFEKDWWKKGMREVVVPVEWFSLGINEISVNYECSSDEANKFRITDIDIKLFFG